MATTPRTSLPIDWDSLFPGTPFKIGTYTVILQPMGIASIAKVIMQIRAFGETLYEKGVTWENYVSPDKLIIVAEVLLTQFPIILEEASNIPKEDLQRLPLDIIVEMVVAVLDINLKSKETMEKNLQSLAGKIQSMTAGVTQA